MVEVSISQKGEDWILVSWSPTEDGDLFWKYEVLIDKGDGFHVTGEPIFNPDTTNKKVTGLKPDTSYTFKVRDWDDNNLQLDSEEVTARTDIRSIPGLEWPAVTVAIVLATLLIGHTGSRKNRNQHK
ncbi:MAG: fibronectin type III domain-containing protein [Thermoplasmata archaeon]